jgi:hypothetical protein
MHDAAINAWLQELATMSGMAGQVELMLKGFDELYRAGDDSPDHAEFFEGIRWIAARTNKTAIERLAMMHKLYQLEGRVTLSLPADLEQLS